MKKRFKFSNHKVDVQWNEAAAAEPVEVMIYEVIGSDPWDGTGISAKDFRKVLDAIPKDRDLSLRVNSRGGDVHEGMAIMNMLEEWPKNVIATIDGIAASTASWMILAADTVRAHNTSQIFIHDAIAFGFGNAEDLRSAADNLDKTSEQIAGMYANKTGRGQRTMRELMRNETLMTGEEAEEMGLVDELIEGKAVRNFTPKEITQMRDKLAALYNVAGTKRGDKPPTTNDNNMKKKLIAMLNKHGVTTLNGVAISATMTDEQLNAVNEEQLEAALNQLLEQKPKLSNEKPPADDNSKNILNLQEEVKKLTELNLLQKKTRITNEVDQLVKDDKLSANFKEKVVNRALKMAEDDCAEYLNELRAAKATPPGADPVENKVLLVSDNFDSIQNFILENGPRFREKFIGRREVDGGVAHNSKQIKLDKEGCREIASRAIKVANAISANKAKILEAWNANAIDAALQRQVILQDMLEAYAITLVNLNVFSTVYQNVPLEGTDKVEVPYFPLQTNASTSFVKGTGYTTAQDWTENSREIPVGGDGNSATSGANAAANTARDRKYLAINFDSYDLRRQPYLNLVKLFQQAANKFGVDIFTDIVSRVVTVGNFGAAVKTTAAAAFSADDVADLDAIATGLFWPQMGRNMVIDHTYFTPLLKDPSFKQYLSYGNADAIQRGRIQSAYSFDEIVKVPNLTTYSPSGEKLSGWINHKSAVLVATANIVPSEEVRALMTRFDIVVDPKTGVSFAYRRFGDVVKDRTTELVECSYGAAKGVDNALRRMQTSA